MKIIKPCTIILCLCSLSQVFAATQLVKKVCPWTINCTGNNISSCTISDPDFYVHDSDPMENILPGKYYFVSAEGIDGQMNPEESSCIYINHPETGQQTISISIRAKKNDLAPPLMAQIPNTKWKWGPGLCTCTSQYLVPYDCPFVVLTDPPGSK